MQVTKPNPFAFLGRQQRCGTTNYVNDNHSDEEMDLSVHRYRKKSSGQNEARLQTCDRLDDVTYSRMRCLRDVSRSITRSQELQVNDDDDDDDSSTDDDDRSVLIGNRQEASSSTTAADDASSEVCLLAPRSGLALALALCGHRPPFCAACADNVMAVIGNG